VAIPGSHACVGNRRGHAAVEVALLMPWILLLFAGIFDFGMYCRALISVENAARAAALRTSTNSESTNDYYMACSTVLSQMKTIPNTGNLTSCNALPLIVTATSGTDSENFPTTRVSVTYHTPQYFALPYLTGRLTVTRVAEMRAKL
jgi:Flp pilus assembly protein TadG